MFKSKKQKPKRTELDNYIIDLYDDKVVVSTRRALWSVTYSANTSPYYLIRGLVEQECTNALENVATYLQVCASMVVVPGFVKNVISGIAEFIPEQPQVSEKDDEIALRETQVMTEQSEEALEKLEKAEK